MDYNMYGTAGGELMGWGGGSQTTIRRPRSRHESSPRYDDNYMWQIVKHPLFGIFYILQSIVGTSHYRECLKFSVNTGNVCGHQSLPVLPKISSHYWQ